MSQLHNVTFLLVDQIGGVRGCYPSHFVPAMLGNSVLLSLLGACSDPKATLMEQQV